MNLFDLDFFTRTRGVLRRDPPWVPGVVMGFLRFVWAVLKVFFLIFFCIQPLFFYSIIGSGSMTPTMETNDIVLYSPIPYGFRISMLGIFPTISNSLEGTTFERIIKTPIFAYTKPRLGDVVAFNIPTVEADFSKRIVGCPGDRIQFKHGVLFINDKPVRFEYQGKYSFIENEVTYYGDIYRETLPNGVSYDVFFRSKPGDGYADNTPVYVLKEWMYFLVGDNRQNSDDSRGMIGPVHMRNIRGKVFGRLFSNGNLRTANVFKFAAGIKFSRCLTWLTQTRVTV